MHASQATTLLLISIGAFAVPLLSGRLKIPAAVGEILFGVLIGPFVLRGVVKSPFFDFLSDFGFAYLMFLAGLELNFQKLERRGHRVLILAAAIAVLIFGAAFATAHYRRWPPFLAVVLGAMSIGILLVALKETGSAQSDSGQTLILIGSAGEFLTILSLTFFNISHRSGLGLPFLLEVSKLILVFLIAYMVLKTLRLLVWWYPRQFSRLVEEDDPSEIGVRAGLALMIAFVAISSLLGVEMILGAFMAGALFSFVFRERGILDTKMASIGQGFFIPIFFIHVGVSFNLGAIRGKGPISLVGQLLLLSLLVKAVPTLLLLLERFRIRELLTAIFLMSSPLTILVAIATVGMDLGIIDNTMNASIILLAVISSMVYPTFFKWIFKKSIRQNPAQA